MVNGEVRLADTHKDVQGEILKAQKIKANLCRFARRGEKCPYPGCTFAHTIAKVEPKETAKKPEVTRRLTEKTLPAKPQPYKSITYGPQRTGQLGENRQREHPLRRSPGELAPKPQGKDVEIKFVPNKPAPKPKMVKLPEKPKGDVPVNKPDDPVDDGKKLLQIDGGDAPAEALKIPVSQWEMPKIPIANRSNSQSSWTTVTSRPEGKTPVKRRRRVN